MGASVRVRPVDPVPVRRDRLIALPDGRRIGVEERGAEHRGTADSVLFVPALGVPLGYAAPFLDRWAGRDRHVVALELPGMPASPLESLRTARVGYRDLIRTDIPAVVAQTGLESTGFVLAGHSLGGQLALLATAAGTVRPTAVAAVASGTTSPAGQVGVARRCQRRIEVALVRTVSAAVGFWPGDRLGFGGRQPASMMRDWCAEGASGRYAPVGESEDLELALSRIGVPVRLISLDGDRVVPPGAAEHLHRRLPAHAEHRRIVGDAPIDHIRWLRDPVAARVIDGLEA